MDRGVLNKATSADFDPVPGYTLSSICSMFPWFLNAMLISGMTHDGLAVSKQLEEYLLSKLSKDHAGVKYKVLRIIRFACENGCSSDFRRLVQRKVDMVRQAQSFRGTADPLRGDSPNKAVRDEASAVLKSLFEAENSGKSIVQPRMQGIGSSDFFQELSPPVASSSAPYSGRVMESMGNPYFDNFGSSNVHNQSGLKLSEIMQSENPTREILSAVSSGMQSMVDSLSRNLPSQLRSNSSSVSSGGYSSHVNVPSSSDWVPPKLGISPCSLVSAPQVDDAKDIVRELCLSNPARVVPSSQSLEKFVSEASKLDGIVLAEMLNQKLGDTSTQWVHKMKILSGIEALHAAGLDVVTTTIREHSDAICGLISSPQCGKKAREVAALIGNNISKITSPEALIDINEEVPRTTTPPTTSLIDIDEDIEGPTEDRNHESWTSSLI